ncbi:MAG TPA: glycoside hydrolase family 88 protein, partial [Tepidisphaeraceae bacterium]|nr:glycoside hydrolase family 88 protein [Tepidisphaeraceae bacterium]
HGQFRLPDGTLARNRPFPNSVWLDDSYMSVPLLAEMGKMTGDSAYYDDAANQIKLFYSHLFVPSAGLFTHAWHMGNPDDQPNYFWGRANGWFAMAIVTLLDNLPANHPARAELIHILKEQAKGLASCQSGTGLWHQMLDRPDSYLETSCTAMFTYMFANAVNHGWLDAGTYGPVAIAGWNGLKTRITSNGQVDGTCVGTGYAADYIYYYHRPAMIDPHGYGPVLLAGSEIIRLLENPKIHITGGGLHQIMVNGKD